MASTEKTAARRLELRVFSLELRAFSLELRDFSLEFLELREKSWYGEEI